MSLLLDALKRAEQEKLARRGSEPNAAAPEAPEARQAPGARRKLELEFDAPAKAAPSPAAKPATDASIQRDRDAAKTVFAAKQTETARGRISGRTKAILGIGIGSLALLAAGGAYVWYEINAAPGSMARAPAPIVQPRPVPPASRAAMEPGSAGSPAAAGAGVASGAAAPGAATMLAANDGTLAPVAPPGPEKFAVNPLPPKAKPQPKPVEKLVASLLKDSANSSRLQPPLKLSRTIVAPRISADVSQGYEALVRGDHAAARKSYEAAVAADATSLDAHLGLATAAARTADREIATRHYRRALALDPKNPSAIAGLAALADFSRPEGLETQLRADITRYPQSPALHFTLGNLYASQTRWTEAQAAYFEAYRLDPESADLAYNLAVSLDHLGQSKLAADFYRRALVAAGQQSAQFDSAQVTRRVAELKH